jgi:hypothetical protein
MTDSGYLAKMIHLSDDGGNSSQEEELEGEGLKPLFLHLLWYTRKKPSPN